MARRRQDGPSDQDTRPVALRPGAWNQYTPDVRSRRRSESGVVSRWEADRVFGQAQGRAGYLPHGCERDSGTRDRIANISTKERRTMVTRWEVSAIQFAAAEHEPGPVCAPAIGRAQTHTLPHVTVYRGYATDFTECM